VKLVILLFVIENGKLNRRNIAKNSANVNSAEKICRRRNEIKSLDFV